MKYSKVIGVLFISGALLSQPTLASAKFGGAGAAAAGAAAVGARAAASSSASAAARSASSASRAADTARRSSSSNAGMYAALGASVALAASNSNAHDDTKNPNTEIARRIALVNVATVSEDAVLIKEAEIARNELIGYQKLRAEKTAQRIAENRQDVIFDGLFDTKNPQDEIAQRINIIKLVGESNDPVLLQEAEYARNELMGYREYKLDNPESRSSGKKRPKDEILNRINIIVLAKDVDDAVVQSESEIASAELTGYQEYRAANKTKPIAKSDFIQDEIDWRLSIINIAQDFNLPVLTREADIAKKELTDYRNFKDGIVAAEDATDYENQGNGDEAIDKAVEGEEAAGITEDSIDWITAAKYGGIFLVFLIMFNWLLSRRKKSNKERDKYIGKKNLNKKNIRW